MSGDFRLASDFLSHHKIRKLRARLGADGVLCWLGLIGYAAINRPDGRLEGLDSEDIALVADWRGTQNFTETLIELRLLDNCDGIFALHNWTDRQPWIVASKKRQAIAQQAAQTRWEKRGGTGEECSEHTSRMHGASMPQSDSNAPYPTQPNHTQPKRSADAKTHSFKPYSVSWAEKHFIPEYPVHRRNSQRPGLFKLLREMRPQPEEAMCAVWLERLRKWKQSPGWLADDGKAVPGLAMFFKNGCHLDDPPILNFAANGNRAHSDNGAARSKVPSYEDLLERDRMKGEPA